jgi:hypothetical protein
VPTGAAGELELHIHQLFELKIPLRRIVEVVVIGIRCRALLRWFSDRKCRSNLAIIGDARTQPRGEFRPCRSSADLRLPELEVSSFGS